MGIIMEDLRYLGGRVRGSIGSRIQKGGGRRAVALRYAGNVGYNVPKNKLPIKKKRKKKRTRTKIVYVYKSK
jgi:hypothetical protein